MIDETNAKDREIGEAFELFNASFREGYRAACHGLPNTGNPAGTPWERGLHAGWVWRDEGRCLPLDPARAYLKRETGIDIGETQ